MSQEFYLAALVICLIPYFGILCSMAGDYLFRNDPFPAIRQISAGIISILIGGLIAEWATQNGQVENWTVTIILAANLGVGLGFLSSPFVSRYFQRV